MKKAAEEAKRIADEKKRLEAEQRLREEEAWLQRLREEEERRRQQLELQQTKEVEIQQKLKRIGQYEAGFDWIKVPGGYRCAGGSHFVHDASL